MTDIAFAMDRLAPAGAAVCDLFAGSGTVSLALSKKYAVTSVDIQEYSRVLCSAILNCHDSEPNVFSVSESLKHWKPLAQLQNAASHLIKLEEQAQLNAEVGNLESISAILEHGCAAGVENEIAHQTSVLGYALTNLNRELKRLKLDGPASVCLRHYGGSFFSYKQAAQLDGIATLIRRHFPENDLMLGALLSTTSHLVNTVGNQFAQPLRPRNKLGQPKVHLVSKIKSDRAVDVISVFLSFLRKYLGLPKPRLVNRAIRGNFVDVLPTLRGQLAAVYADPPYTRDHYSRFYHVLETIAFGDDPDLSLSNLGGGRATSRGSYRTDRHQSPFCIKSQAPTAFSQLFSLVADLKVPLLLSYSGFNPQKEARPRVMSVEDVIALARNRFASVEVTEIAFTHNKLNSMALNKLAGGTGEILLSCC